MRIVFAGTPAFALPALRALIDSPHAVVAALTQPDRPAGRGRRPRPSPVKGLALEAGIPLLQPASLRPPEFQDRLAALQADLMVVVAYGLILPQAVLAIPRLGCVNVHASLLPRWRGAAPIQWALIAGDQTSGATIMQMDAGLDTGPILARSAFEVPPNASAGELHDRIAELGAGLLAGLLPDIEGGRVAPLAQDEARATYAPKLGRADARIDWSLSAREVHDRVRAFNPWPIAWTEYPGGELRILETRVLDEAEAADPGRVLAGAGGDIVAGTGRGRLEMLRLQRPGRRPVSARDFANAFPLTGAVLGRR